MKKEAFMEYKVIEGLYYTKGDEWMKVEGDTGTVGITDYAQDKLGDVVYVEEATIGKKVKKDEVTLTVESVKAASDINAPVSGKVTEVNKGAVSDSKILNKDPYGAGWLFKIKIENPDELKELMNAKAYSAYRKE
jgi:glycine cleavage system H protein